jgi:hypothetical protein
MARFYFHLHEVTTIARDEEGVDLPSAQAARQYAVAAARDIMAAEVMEGKLPLSAFILVESESGEQLEVRFSKLCR